MKGSSNKTYSMVWADIYGLTEGFMKGNGSMVACMDLENILIQKAELMKVTLRMTKNMVMVL